MMNAIDAFLLSFDQAWNHRWESLEDVLEGVTEEEAVFSGEEWRSVEREDGWPEPGSIAWQVAHLAWYKTLYGRAILHAVGRGPEPTAERTPASSFAEERQRLHTAHLGQREAMASLSDEDLARPVEDGVSLAEFLATTTRHDIWHAGQIAVIRRLFRERG